MIRDWAGLWVGCGLLAIFCLCAFIALFPGGHVAEVDPSEEEQRDYKISSGEAP